MNNSFDQTALCRVGEMMLGAQRPAGRQRAVHLLQAQLGPYGDGTAIQLAVDRYFTGHDEQRDIARER